jgi:invasion protein IalB
MRHLVIMFGAALMISPVASAPVFAQAAPAAQSAPQAAKNSTPDPNEVVCEKEEDTGSRISAHRVCMTRSQWAEQRRLNRQDIDKMQTQRPCNDGC